MTFKQLILSHFWTNISSIFIETYPEAEKDLEGYKMVFEKLAMMDPEEIDMSIVITNEKDDFDAEAYIDISGLYNNPKNEEEHYSQGIEFTPWREWLGMDISEKSLSIFSEQEIIVHCLYEMTFVGFKEGDIQKVINRTQKNMEDYKAMSEEEKCKNTISVEEFLKEWDLDEDEV
ncbi:DUF6557 family protein [Aequorivita capsosiphonis]|uniref:DUF6557 family protein n=1 Tax=Aequorivita capsosiphonis TaxID=487317 RepID=UPI00041E4C69|nr:DUF6557 family protein [Aequorivita capsosiphonis]